VIYGSMNLHNVREIRAKKSVTHEGTTWRTITFVDADGLEMSVTAFPVDDTKPLGIIDEELPHA
jgi:hypothetical protein